MNRGRLYGIGVGPGSPDLLTIRAARVLANSDVILAAASAANDYSIAYSAAAPYLKQGVPVRQLKFPMTKDAASLQTAWDVAARETLDVLDQFATAAFLTIGDPLAYSTFAYLLHALRKMAPELDVEIIPGITSWQAAAARTGFVLCEGSQSFTVISGIGARDALERQLQGADNAAILKVYRHHEDIKGALQATGRLETATLVSMVEREGEFSAPCSAALRERPPYMSLILSPALLSGDPTHGQE